MSNVFYRGKIDFKGYNFTYLLENFVITLYPKEEDKEAVTYSLFFEELSKGVYSLKNKSFIEESFLVASIDGSDNLLILFFQDNTRIMRNNVFRLHDIVLYIPCVAYAITTSYKKIDRLSVNCDELNCIYPVSNFVKLTDCSKEEIHEGVLSLETLDFNSSTSNSFSFVFNNYKLDAFFDVSRYVSFNNDSKPLSLDSYLNFNIQDGLNFDSLIDTFLLADNFVKFMCYRNNIFYNSIKLFSKNDDEKYEELGHLFVNISNREKEKDYIIKNKYIPYKLIEGIEENIFKDIAKGHLYNRHYPSTTASNQYSYPSRFILITSAFEWEYKQCYKNKNKEKSKSRIKAETQVAIKLDELEKNKELFSRKARQIFKRLKKDIEHISLAEKIIDVKNDYCNLVNYFGCKLYQRNNEIFDIDKVAKRLSKQRNDYAHGNLDEKVEELSFLDLRFIEIVVYILQMSRYHNSVDNTIKAIEKLFLL